MGYNRSGAIRKKRLRRAKRETERLLLKATAEQAPVADKAKEPAKAADSK
jgi:hypothetical protein